MARASKACSQPRCGNRKPCPVPGHERKPWVRDGDRPRSTLSGSRQQARARFVLERDHGICHVCGYAGADEADHVIPTAEGGKDHVSNMAAIHSVPCHRDKTLVEAARARTR